MSLHSFNFRLLKTDEQNLISPTAESPKKFWWCFIFLFFAVIVFHGKIVPYSNELVYLLRLKPDFLPNDWTFSRPANEHWLFNFIFSFPVKFFSLEAVGWAGRILVWSLSLFALLKLGRRWEISSWAIAAAIFLWLAFQQAAVGEEWIFGGFEAKTISYVCLLFALDEFSERKIVLPAVLLGLSFSFHPAVGFWAILAVGLALFLEKIRAADFSKIVGLTFVFSLPGLLPILFEQANADVNSFENWRFVVLYRVPGSLDMYQFSRSGMILLFAMLIFNCFALRKSEDFALRLLLKFQVWLGAFFALGLLFRLFELYPFLRFFPTRLFPVFTPLFFIFTSFYFIRRLTSKRQKIFVSLFVILVIALLNPLGRGFEQARETFRTWTDAPDDLQKTSRWIAENTPPDSTVIQPPNRREIWYLSERATIVSFTYPTFDRLSEWRERLANLTGNLQISKGDAASEEIEAAFNQLSAAQIGELKRKYGASHLVSRAVYPYPIVFETETYKVYQLP